jgi:hypothetical protein
MNIRKQLDVSHLQVEEQIQRNVQAKKKIEEEKTAKTIT